MTDAKLQTALHAREGHLNPQRLRRGKLFHKWVLPSICHLSSVISFEPKARMNSRYAHGEISDGLISERPPQKTLV
jgi:hypothetical protein